MHVCILDGREIRDRETLHDVLAASLRLPDWYGRNLDALYDCLTDAGEEIEIRLQNESALREHLGKYAEALVRAICMAAGENPLITWKRDEEEYEFL